MKTTKENYFQRIEQIGLKNLSEKMQKAHAYVANATSQGSDWRLYERNDKIREAINKQFALLDAELANTKGKSSVQTRPESRPVASSTKKQHEPKHVLPKSADPNQDAVKRAEQLPTLKYGTAVETLDPHLVFLSQYLNITKKPVPVSRVRNFALRIVRGITGRVLRQKSKYATHIEKMRDNITRVLQTTKGAMATVSIPAGEKRVIEKLVQDEHKMRSVQLLSQYAGQTEKRTTVDKVKRLYNAMFNAVEKGAIPEDDRYFNKIVDAMKDLKKYVEKGNERAVLPLLPAELSGILGCGCKPADSVELNGIEELQDESGTAVEVDEPFVGKSGVKPVNSLEFMKRKFHRYQIADPWVRVFGLIEPGKHVVVFSKEKFGKTTALVDFAGYLSREHGRVLIVQKEEELSGTFQDKFEQTRAANPNLDVIEEMPDDETLCGYKFIFLDSVTRLKISPDQLLELQSRLTPTTLIAVLHATKDGQHRGANTYVQDASQIVEFPEFGAARGKGRFKGCTGELVRFAEPRE